MIGRDRGGVIMIYQSSINFGGIRQRLFLSIESNEQLASTALHKHKFNEFFFLDDGRLSYEINGRHYEMKSGDLLVIPANVYHRCIDCSKNHRYFHMFTDGFVRQEVKAECDIKILKEIIDLSRTFDRKSMLKLRTFITFLCYEVLEQDSFDISEQVDYDFLIDKNLHVDTSVEDLAKTLGVSVRHTERLVLNHTGKTFYQYRLDLRMQSAKDLIRRGDLSKKQIAARVGFQSYKGFRNAYVKYFGLKEEK